MSMWAEAQYVIDSLAGSAGSGQYYFSPSGNFADVISKLGKKATDFTVNNFKAVISGVATGIVNAVLQPLNTGSGIPSGSSSGNINGCSLSYNNGSVTISGTSMSGSTNFNTTVNYEPFVQNSSASSSQSIQLVGYLFSPSGTWK